MTSITSVVVFVYVSALYLVQHLGWGFILGKRTECYGQLGCFSTGHPFKSVTRPVSLVPVSPDFIRTRFILFTRQNPSQGQGLDARKIEEVKARWTQFRARETKLIVHGFLDDYNTVPWLTDMKDELLTHGDYNTIIVDWHHGNLPPYTQATANTRVVGAQIAVLIKQLQTDFNLTAGQIHIIGHSLGAHLAGYAGERTAGLGRISGLDPAGPYFFGTDKVVRLDPTDAVLVDTIHSDGKGIIGMPPGSGIFQAVGHMDFYPNLGYGQPGCELGVFNLMTNFIDGGTRELLACNHLRAIKFFTESINTKCPFMALTCDSELDFMTKKCKNHSHQARASMGFRADQHRPAMGSHHKYYTTTAEDAPFCHYHIDVSIDLANATKAKIQRGIIMVRLYGDKRKSDSLRLDQSPVVYNPGSTHVRSLGLPYDVGTVSSLEFKWHHIPSLSDVSTWFPFRWRRPKLHLQAVEIVRDDDDQRTRFCTDDIVVESGKTKPLSVLCT